LKKYRWISFFVIVMFLAAVVVFMYARHGSLRFTTGTDSGGVSDKTYKFTSDTSYYFFTTHEGKFVANTDYMYRPNLEHLPFKLGSWKGKDLKTDDKNILYLRYYTNTKDGAVLYLIAVNGTTESLFHTSEVCYLGDGWKISQRKHRAIELNGGIFQVRYAVAEKDGFKHLVLYWYIWPDSRRRISDGMTMFRISVRISGSVEKAENKAVDFIKELSNLRIDYKKEESAVAVQPSSIPEVKLGKGKRTEFTPNKEKALTWLKAQIVPNDIVPEPAEDRRYLVASYRVPKNAKAYRYIFSKASIYDNALAIVAFSMAREFDPAEKIIEAASRVLSPDGDLWFTFNTHNSWPNKQDNVGAIVRSGASAWFGYAMVYYLRTRLIAQPALLNTDNQAIGFLKIARSIADKILSRQILDKKDLRYGFFTGGEGNYAYKLNTEDNKIEEVFKPGKIAWASIEHNIDIYFFLRDLARLTSNKKYETASRILKESLLTTAWNNKIGQFDRGMRSNGRDETRALDCASWGAMFLHTVGEDKLANTALDSTSAYFVNTGRSRGFKPYVDALIYDEPEINKLFYPKNPGKSWKNVSIVWPEGSLGVAMADIKLGRKKDAKKIISGIVKLQDAKGGVPYATESILYQFSDNPSVAGAAWLIMTISALEDEGVRELFWGK